MASRAPLLHEIQLRGIELAPSQVWGGVRIVPLLRKDIRQDLRLAKRTYDEDVMVVARKGA
jgi:hypothetical protein